MTQKKTSTTNFSKNTARAKSLPPYSSVPSHELLQLPASPRPVLSRRAMMSRLVATSLTAGTSLASLGGGIFVATKNATGQEAKILANGEKQQRIAIPFLVASPFSAAYNAANDLADRLLLVGSRKKRTIETQVVAFDSYKKLLTKIDDKKNSSVLLPLEYFNPAFDATNINGFLASGYRAMALAKPVPIFLVARGNIKNIEELLQKPTARATNNLLLSQLLDDFLAQQILKRDEKNQPATAEPADDDAVESADASVESPDAPATAQPADASPNATTTDASPDATATTESPDATTTDASPDATATTESPDATTTAESPDTAATAESPDTTATAESPDTTATAESPDTTETTESPDAPTITKPGEPTVAESAETTTTETIPPEDLIGTYNSEEELLQQFVVGKIDWFLHFGFFDSPVGKRFLRRTGARILPLARDSFGDVFGNGNNPDDNVHFITCEIKKLRNATRFSMPLVWLVKGNDVAVSATHARARSRAKKLLLPRQKRADGKAHRVVVWKNFFFPRLLYHRAISS